MAGKKRGPRASGAVRQRRSPAEDTEPEGRNQQLERVLKLIQRLTNSSSTLGTLAKDFGVSERTIRRDLQALSLAGITVEEESPEDGSKHWPINSRAKLKALEGLIHVQHYLALRLAMGTPEGVAPDTSVFADLEALAGEIERAVGTKGGQELARTESCFCSYEKFTYARTPPETLWPLIRAISEHRVCEVTHHSIRSDTPKKFRILPLKLFVHDSAVYLHALACRHGDIIVLNLKRLESIVVTEERQDPPDDYHAEDWERMAFRIYVGKQHRRFHLRFAPDVAPYIRERTWHPTQTLEELPGGSVELRFECTDSPDVRGWIAQWRGSVTVLEPEEMRHDLRRFATFISATYGAEEAGVVEAVSTATAEGERRT